MWTIILYLPLLRQWFVDISESAYKKFTKKQLALTACLISGTLQRIFNPTFSGFFVVTACLWKGEAIYASAIGWSLHMRSVCVPLLCTK
jgi:hypothetical protein